MKFQVLFLCLILVNQLLAIEIPEKCNIISSEPIFNQAPFRECHAATITELNDGSLMIAWFGGSFEGCTDVEIWISVYHSGRWSYPRSIANGIVNDSLRYPCWNPVLFQTPDKKVALFYKVGPNPREWWGMVICSEDNGETWSSPKRLPDGILGPIKNKPVTLPSGIILSPSSVESSTERWNTHIERSVDGGKSWQKIAISPESPAKVIQPTLLVHSPRQIQALMRSNQNYIMESWSDDEGLTWTAPTKTNVLNPNSGIDAVTLKSGLHLLVYNPMVGGKNWVNGRNKLNVAISTDGKSWHDIQILEDQPTGEFSYPSVIETSDQTIHIVYTSNRKFIRHVVLRF